MQPQPTPTPIPVTRSGVCVVDGYGIRVSVERGRLVIRDGTGRAPREARFARATSNLRRLVLIGHTGFVTLDAFRWLADVGARYVQLDPDGRVLVASAEFGLHDPRLRRAQAAAFGTPTGKAIARDLLLIRKLAGQARIAEELGAIDTVAEIGRAAVALDQATTPAELMVPEAAAALAYWSAWASLDVRWAKADLARVPDNWRTFGGRASPLTGNPRTAANPSNAILNYLYGVLEAAARLSCLAIGLDPGLGVLHADQRARDSLALDVMEAVRPDVDAVVLDLLRNRTFRSTDFVERRDGSCRIVPPLTHELVATLPAWETRLGPIVEGVARAFAAGPDSRVGRVPTVLTGDRRSAGRDRQRRSDRRPASPALIVARSCRECGGAVPAGRDYCDTCLPEATGAQRAAFVSAGQAELRRRRDAGADRSHGGDAGRIRGAKVAASRRAAAAWRRSNGPAGDPEVFRSDVMPLLQGVSAARLAELTGLSRPYCGAILRGERAPHPRWWETLREVGAATS
jgi:CRISPR-associated endonuclease Cas1